MLGFECDCSQECDWYYEEWTTEEHVSDGTIICSECGETIPAGKPYQFGSGVAEDDYPEGDDFDNAKFTDFATCVGCQRIAARFCPSGYPLGELPGTVSSCLGYYYNEDPDGWDQAEVDDEDEKNRARGTQRTKDREEIDR